MVEIAQPLFIVCVMTALIMALTLLLLSGAEKFNNTKPSQLLIMVGCIIFMLILLASASPS